MDAWLVDQEHEAVSQWAGSTFSREVQDRAWDNGEIVEEAEPDIF